MWDALPLELCQMVAGHLTSTEKTMLASIGFDHRLGYPRDVKPSDCDTIASARFVFERMADWWFIKATALHAIESGNIELVEWILANRGKYTFGDIDAEGLYDASYSIPFKSFRWFYERIESIDVHKHVWGWGQYYLFEIQEEHIEDLVWACSKPELRVKMDGMYLQAIALKSVKILNWLYTHEIVLPYDEALWEKALRVPKNMEVLNWLNEKLILFNKEGYIANYTISDLCNLKWVHDFGITPRINAKMWLSYDSAGWLHANGYDPQTLDVEFIIKNDCSIKRLEWLRTVMKVSVWPDVYEFCEDEKALGWFLEQGIPWNERTLCNAISGGNPRWLYEHGAPISEKAFEIAVYHDIDLAKKIAENLFKDSLAVLNEDAVFFIYREVVSKNSAELLDWLHTIVPLPEDTEVLFGVVYGAPYPLEAYRWLEQKGFESGLVPWDQLESIVQDDDLAALEWAFEKEKLACMPFDDKFLEKMFELVLSKGSLEMVKWLYENHGCMPKDSLLYSCKNSLSVVKYMHRFFPISDEPACVAVAASMDIKRYLMKNGMYSDVCY